MASRFQVQLEEEAVAKTDGDECSVAVMQDIVTT